MSQARCPAAGSKASETLAPRPGERGSWAAGPACAHLLIREAGGEGGARGGAMARPANGRKAFHRSSAAFPLGSGGRGREPGKVRSYRSTEGLGGGSESHGDSWGRRVKT